MDYRGKTIAITGKDGFIGKALTKAFTEMGNVTLHFLDGDIRNPNTFAQLNYTFDYLFHFAAPSSQVLFNRDQQYCVDVTLSGFMNAARICKQNGIKLIYPSTGLLSSKQEPNTYARTKRVCEEYADLQEIDSLGLRIFATYGPGEGHKRDYASVPYLFARDILQRKVPTVFGDGEQVRDFIYIDDTVQAILHLAEQCQDKVIDVGSGVPISFNQAIETINKHSGLPAMKPRYIEKPTGYVQETVANTMQMLQFYQPKHTFDDGIIQMLHYMKGGNVNAGVQNPVQEPPRLPQA